MRLHYLVWIANLVLDFLSFGHLLAVPQKPDFTQLNVQYLAESYKILTCVCVCVCVCLCVSVCDGSGMFVGL